MVFTRRHWQLLNYPTLVGEAARVLRPGGLFLSGEWEPFPIHNATVSQLDNVIPATFSLVNMVNETLHKRYNMDPVGTSVPGWLEQSGRFANITPQVYKVPIGDWHQDPLMREFGNDMRATLVRYGESLKPMLKEAGYAEIQVETVLQAYVHELHTVRGLMGVYRTVHARKV